jgi:hypothetical protein
MGKFRPGAAPMNPVCDLDDEMIPTVKDSPPDSPTISTASRLPSGRSVFVRTVQGREELEIRTAERELEVRITLTEAGPVVQLRGARLDVDSPDAVAFHCRRFEVYAGERLDLQSGGDAAILACELRVQTERDVRIDGQVIRLNCEQAGAESAHG